MLLNRQNLLITTDSKDHFNNNLNVNYVTIENVSVFIY